MAAVFRFRLQKVLDLRERELDSRRRELAQAIREETARAAALELVRAERAAFDERLCHVDDRPVSALELRARLAASQAHAVREAQTEQSLEAARRATTAVRERTVEAHRAVETLRRLRERAHAKWLREIDAQERKILDDIQSRYGEDPLR